MDVPSIATHDVVLVLKNQVQFGEIILLPVYMFIDFYFIHLKLKITT